MRISQVVTPKLHTSDLCVNFRVRMLSGGSQRTGIYKNTYTFLDKFWSHKLKMQVQIFYWYDWQYANKTCAVYSNKKNRCARATYHQQPHHKICMYHNIHSYIMKVFKEWVVCQVTWDDLNHRNGYIENWRITRNQLSGQNINELN